MKTEQNNISILSDISLERTAIELSSYYQNDKISLSGSKFFDEKIQQPSSNNLRTNNGLDPKDFINIGLINTMTYQSLRETKFLVESLSITN